MSAVTRWFPVDALAVLGVTGLAYAAINLPAGAPVRVAVALAYLLMVPGYALATAVFPAGRYVEADRSINQSAPAALDGYERLAVSLGLSLALLPLFGLALPVIGWAFSPKAVLNLTALFVLALTVVGVLRRVRLDRDVRYDPPIGRWRRGVGDAVVRAPMADRVLNVILAAAVVIALASLTVGIAAPQDGSAYTSLALMTRSDGGELVAADYPTEFTKGQGERLVLTVKNREGDPFRYVVVVQLQRIEDGRVTERDELDRYNKHVPPGGTWEIRHEVAPTMTGEDLRLTYLLYRGTPPDAPTVENSYRHVTLWIDVSS